jgi:DtxR family Mn-dependent transcriptional regulator
LNVSAPAVTMAIRRLKRDGCIHVDSEGRILLSSSGNEIATRLLHRHHLIERMLTEVFGMEWFKVHEEAEQLEHAVSGDFERKLVEKLGEGGACPHGNFVGLDRSADRRSRGWKPLSELRPAGRATVMSVYERDRRLLEYFDGLGICPGASLESVSQNYDETCTLRIGGKTVHLSLAAAGKVWVQ